MFALVTGVWASGFAAFYAIYGAHNWAKDRQRTDLFRAAAGTVASATMLLAALS